MKIFYLAALCFLSNLSAQDIKVDVDQDNVYIYDPYLALVVPGHSPCEFEFEKFAHEPASPRGDTDTESSKEEAEPDTRLSQAEPDTRLSQAEQDLIAEAFAKAKERKSEGANVMIAINLAYALRQRSESIAQMYPDRGDWIVLANKLRKILDQRTGFPAYPPFYPCITIEE